MATMTFLTIPDNTLAFQNTAGIGTLTTSAPVAYDTSYWTGHAGLRLSAYNTLARTELTTDSADPTTGSAIVRFTRATDRGAQEVVLSIGNGTSATASFVAARITASDTLQLVHRGTSDTEHTFGALAVPAGGDYYAYIEWTATTVGIALDDGAVTTTTRTGASQAWDGGSMIGVGCWPAVTGKSTWGDVDGVAIFDAPLTDSERSYMRLADTPWTWQMSMTDPITAYVDTVPSNGTRADAPVLTLP